MIASEPDTNYATNVAAVQHPTSKTYDLKKKQAFFEQMALHCLLHKPVT
jgi:hypothetical protein